jgi:hypothetical protein
MGRTVPELPGIDLREIIEGRYRIVYRVQGKRVEIVTVFEGHRQFPAGGQAMRQAVSDFSQRRCGKSRGDIASLTPTAWRWARP